MSREQQDQTEQERERRAQLIAAILGEPNIRVVKWQQLMREGVVVRLTITRTRFRRKLTLEDLGLVPPKDEKARKAMERLFVLGSKSLLPQERLERLERIEWRARKLLKRFSYQTEWGSFIPATAYLAWREKNQRLAEEYERMRDEILADYPRIVTQVMREYVQAAKHAYAVLHQVNPDHLSEAELRNQGLYLARVAKSVRNLMPTPQEIRSSFSFTFLPTYIDLPALVQETLPLPAESPEVRAWELEQEATRERERQLAEMNRDVVRKAREQKEQMIDSFLTTLVTQTRALVYEACLNVAGALKSGGELQVRHIVQLKTLIEQVSALNFYSDRDIDHMTGLIRGLIDRPHQNRSPTEIQQVLTEIATVTRSTLLALNYEFNETREVREDREYAQIADLPTYEEVREARTALGLDTAPALLPAEDRGTREEREQEGVLLPASPAASEERSERS